MNLLSLPQRLAIGAGIVSVLGLLFYLWLQSEKAEAVSDYKVRVEQRADGARDQSAEQHVRDTIINIRNEEDLHHAIDQAPKGGELSPAARALNCERLRKLGRIPPACRPAGSNGTEAGSH